MKNFDEIKLAKELIRFPTIMTEDRGIMKFLSKKLSPMGFKCKIIKSKGNQLMSENREKFTLKKMTEKLSEIMEKIEKDIPQQVGLKLPKLKKVAENKSKPSKIKLPKLKKLTDKEVSV